MVTTLDLFAMLIAMTFNGAYFAAVVLGYGLGTLLLGHLRENYQRHIGAAPGAAPDLELCCGTAVPPAPLPLPLADKGKGSVAPAPAVAVTAPLLLPAPVGANGNGGGMHFNLQGNGDSHHNDNNHNHKQFTLNV